MIASELLANLYGGQSPYSSAEHKYIDSGYPHTNIRPAFLSVLFSQIGEGWIAEFGSMLGGSALCMASVLSQMGMQAEIVCVDPFTGDVNMWDWEASSSGWKFLRLEGGIPTIYKRFLANVAFSGHSARILPINATSIVGMRLISRLRSQGRISSMPRYAYLDSAHEKGETLLELRQCWDILEAGGVLFGDDWGWDAVREDVSLFSQEVDGFSSEAQAAAHAALPGSSVQGRILLYEGQWAIFKL